MLPAFWILALVTGVRWYLVVLIYISPMTCDVGNFHICLFAMRTSALVRCLLSSLARFLSGLFSCCVLGASLILDGSSLSPVSRAKGFSQSEVSLHSHDTGCHRT